MYTSGSTGVPKGVAILHRGIVRLLFGIDYVELGPSRRHLQLASPAFDAATFEIWGPLLHGGRCVLFPGRVPDLDVLEHALREHEIDTLFLTTALFHAVVDESAGILGGVRQLLVGGEVLSADHLRRAMVALPGTSIVHVYGPTEATTFATAYRVPRDFPRESRSVPIGRPIGNTTIHLLDPIGRLVPSGVPGEVHVGGPGVARGYFHQAGLTAERFIADPFDPASHGVLYRTGDIGRRLADGSIDFLGRVDSQVKIRGFRVEPGEVETALRQHPATRDAFVVAEEDGGHGRRLVAYVVGNGLTAPTASELREFLGVRLPDHMVPSAYVLMDRLPLSITGKVDRRRLPAPATARVEDGAGESQVGATPVVARLVGIFAELLGRERVGADEDFFELGGHSLLAMQAVSRARRALGVKLPLGSLFARPTAAGLAQEVASIRRSCGGEPLPDLARVERPDACPILASQRPIWDLFRRHPGKAMANTSRAYRIRGPLSLDVVRETLAMLVERHESLRTNFVEADGEPTQVVGPVGRVQLAFHDLGQVGESRRLAEAQRLFDEASSRRPDLARGNVFCPEIVRLGEDDHLLIVVFSHIIMDGVSLNTFLEEFSALYEALGTGRKAALAELSLRPTDVACWESRFFRTAAASEQIEYWRKPFDGAIAGPGIPGDGPGQEDGDLRAHHTSLLLPRAIVDAIRELGRREGCTLPMTVNAALCLLYHELTGQEDIRMGIPLACRHRQGLEGLISCLRKRFVLRIDASGRPTFRELLRRVRDLTMQAYLNQDVSQEVAFPEIGPDHPCDWRNVPISSNFIENAAPSLRLAGLDVSNLPRTSAFLHFPLSAAFVDGTHGLTLTLYGWRDLYSARRIRALAEGIRAAFENLAIASHRRLPTGSASHPILDNSGLLSR